MTNSTEQTRGVIDGFYAAAVSGDLAAAMSYVHPDVEVREGPNLPFGRTYRGHDGMAEILAALTPYLEMNKLTMRSIIADGDQGVAVLTTPIRGENGAVEAAEHWQLQGGLLRQGQIYLFDPSGIQEPR
ncbi:MAG: nuclear transport factor 2 family protein [Actinomycetota bacterium]